MRKFFIHEKDCMELLPTIPAASVDCVITDPPYILAAGSSNHQDRATSDIWECLWSANKPTGHPAEKPVDLIARIIQACELQSGSVVLDPFMGSGTTGVASMECDCDFIGSEQDTKWFKVAETRIKAAQSQGAKWFSERNPTPHEGGRGYRPPTTGESGAQTTFIGEGG